jgi:hypothetical protein
MSCRKRLVEKELGVILPDQYVAFLNKYGYYTDPPLEVYGVRENLRDHDGVPSVIGVTRYYRRLRDLPHRFIVIHRTGEEDEFVCLDTRDGRVYAFSRAFGDRKLADSFDEWFERYIIEFAKEIKRFDKKHKRCNLTEP